MTDSLRERLEAAELTRVGILAEPEDKSRIAADRALGVFRQFWNDHRDAIDDVLWDVHFNDERVHDALNRVERVLFGTSPDEEQRNAARELTEEAERLGLYDEEPSK